MHNGALLPDAIAEHGAAEALAIAGRASEDFAYEATCLAWGLVLIYGGGPERERGFEVINESREHALRRRPSAKAVRIVDTELAREKARNGDLDGAIQVARAIVEHLFDSGDMTSRGPAVSVLVESLLARGSDGDRAEGEAAVERLAAVAVDTGFVLHDLPLL